MVRGKNEKIIRENKGKKFLNLIFLKVRIKDILNFKLDNLYVYKIYS